MKTKSNEVITKSFTQAQIAWLIQVGNHYGTISGSGFIQDLLQIDRVTFYRWATGRAAAPYSALELLRLHAFGEPPGGRSSAWRGFRFYADRLITEDNRELSPADLKAVFFWKQMAFSNLDQAARREIYSELRSIYQRA